MKKGMGFTLVELMVTLVVAGILVTVGVPSFRTIIQNNRITTQANTFVTALTIARIEAVKRSTTVRVTALDGSDAANEWGPGWRVWVDEDGNNAFTAADTELRVFAELSGNSSFDSVDDITELQYQSTGYLSVGAGVTQTFDLTIPNCTGNQARRVVINQVGRHTVSRLAC